MNINEFSATLYSLYGYWARRWTDRQQRPGTDEQFVLLRQAIEDLRKTMLQATQPTGGARATNWRNSNRRSSTTSAVDV